MTEVFIQGFLGRDCTVQESANGSKFLSLVVGSNDFVKGVQKTQWFDCTQFNYNDKMVEHLKKGSAVNVIGQLDVENETGKDGVSYIRRRVTVHNLTFNSSGSKPQGEETKETTAPEKKKAVTPPSDAELNKKVTATKPEPVGDTSDLPF